MNKILNITWKDLTLLLHDKAALLFMLAAPFLLTLAMGAVTGSFSGGGSSTVENIPVVVVNLDQGDFGQTIADAFKADSTSGLFVLTEMDDEAVARLEVENDRAAAVVLIPAGFSDSLLPHPVSGQGAETVSIEVYQNPVRPLTSGVVHSVVVEVVNQLEVSIASQMAGGQSAFPRILIAAPEDDSDEPVEFSTMAYLAPGMAVFFLMYTATQGGRSILAEQTMGTLPRMLASPTLVSQILSGKVLSTFTAGFLQVGVLILAAGMLFGLNWGDPLPLLLLTAAAAAGATGWGILLAAVAKNPFQVSSVGSALMLVFGILGGTFIPTSNFSDLMLLISRITPNAWAMDGFSALASGKGMAGVTGPASALFVMTAVLFGAAVLLSRRGWAMGLRK